MSVHKKFQPNRSSRLAGKKQHLYIYECLVLLYRFKNIHFRILVSTNLILKNVSDQKNSKCNNIRKRPFYVNLKFFKFKYWSIKFTLKYVNNTFKLLWYKLRITFKFSPIFEILNMDDIDWDKNLLKTHTHTKCKTNLFRTLRPKSQPPFRNVWTA